MFRNGVIVAWRLVDYGRLGIWIALFAALCLSFKKRSLPDHYFRDTLLIAAAQFAIILPILLIYRNFIGHRYLLTFLIPVAVSSSYWVLKYSRYPKAGYITIMALLVAGHFLIYPKTIAQGWDATTAHWPYYKLRDEMILKMESSSISVENTGSFFPNIFPIDDIDLTGKRHGFKGADIKNDSLILFSNIFNVPDNIINELYDQTKWRKKLEMERRGVFLILFEKINNP
jgi:hypothetical protein